MEHLSRFTWEPQISMGKCDDWKNKDPKFVKKCNRCRLMWNSIFHQTTERIMFITGLLNTHHTLLSLVSIICLAAAVALSACFFVAKISASICAACAISTTRRRSTLKCTETWIISWCRCEIYTKAIYQNRIMHHLSKIATLKSLLCLLNLRNYNVIFYSPSYQVLLVISSYKERNG